MILRPSSVSVTTSPRRPFDVAGAAGSGFGRRPVSDAVPGAARMREIGGRTVRFAVSSVTARFGFGVCGSISETLSTAGFGAGSCSWLSAARLWRAGFLRGDGRESRFRRATVGLERPPKPALRAGDRAGFVPRSALSFRCFGSRQQLLCPRRPWNSWLRFSRGLRVRRRRLGRSGGLGRLARGRFGRRGFGRSFLLAFGSLKSCSWP